MMKKGLRILCVVLIALLSWACVVDVPDTKITSEIRTFFKGTYKVYPAMEKHMPKLVAILPFSNASESQQGGQEVRRGFYNHFCSLPFKDMELIRVDNLLEKAGLTDPVEISKKSPQELGKILGVDAVIYGEISNFDKLFAVVYSQVAVGRRSRCTTRKRVSSCGQESTRCASMKGGFLQVPSVSSPPSLQRP